MGTRLKRFRRACAYAAGNLSRDEAQWVIVDCEDRAGWYPLLILSAEDALERAREIFVDHPELSGFIAEGCAKVRRKWESYGDEMSHAIEWAIDNAEEFAASEDIIFVRREDEEDATAESGGEE
jgi:hypothetical protein